MSLNFFPMNANTDHSFSFSNMFFLSYSTPFLRQSSITLVSSLEKILFVMYWKKRFLVLVFNAYSKFFFCVTFFFFLIQSYIFQALHSLARFYVPFMKDNILLIIIFFVRYVKTSTVSSCPPLSSSLPFTPIPSPPLLFSFFSAPIPSSSFSSLPPHLFLS